MFHPGPVRHRVGIGVDGRHLPTLFQQIKTGSEVPAEVWFHQGLQCQVQDEQEEQSVEGREREGSSTQG